MKADPREIYYRILDAGYSPAQACGILGNIPQESGFVVDVLGFDKTGSYGLCQWLGVRKKALFAFAKQLGKLPGDPLVQVDFLLYELQTTERTADRLLRQCQSPSGAAHCFSRWFERPAKRFAHNDKRAAYAEQFSREFFPTRCPADE